MWFGMMFRSQVLGSGRRFRNRHQHLHFLMCFKCVFIMFMWLGVIFWGQVLGSGRISRNRHWAMCQCIVWRYALRTANTSSCNMQLRQPKILFLATFLADAAGGTGSPERPGAFSIFEVRNSKAGLLRGSNSRAIRRLVWRHVLSFWFQAQNRSKNTPGAVAPRWFNRSPCLGKPRECNLVACEQTFDVQWHIRFLMPVSPNI